jgi:hypothetical protein
LSVAQWGLCAALVAAVAVERPARAMPLQNADETAAPGSLIEPAAGTEGFLPAEFFLPSADPDAVLVDTVVDQLRSLRGVLRRAAHSLGGDPPESGVARETVITGSTLDVAEQLDGQGLVETDRARRIVDRARDAEEMFAGAIGRASLPTQDVGLQGAPMMAVDAAGASAMRSDGAAPAAGNERQRVLLLAVLIDLAHWLRSEPAFALLAGTLVGLFLWVRRAGQRAG